MKTNLIAPFVLASIAALSLAGCSKEPAASQPTAGSQPAPAAESGLSKIKVGYIGLTCEAPLFTAFENGFFKEEGLDVEFVKCEWAQYKDALALGSFDVTHHLIMMFLKPLEQGMDVKITAGVHTGCLRVQTGADSAITKVTDLKGKKIGVPGMGTPPFIFANRALGDAGVDASKDVEWRAYPAGELGLALSKGEVDAIATSEPIGTMLLADGKVKNVVDQAKDEPYAHEYCCAVIANGAFAAKNPDLTAKATRAILKGAKWVQMNPRAAAQMSVEKKYLASNPELNTSAIGNLNYMPSISGGEAAILTAATAMKAAGMLQPTTDIEELSKRAWLPLPGITDQWVADLKVEKVAMGQIPDDQPERLLAELGKTRENMTVATCCAKASKVKM